MAEVKRAPIPVKIPGIPANASSSNIVSLETALVTSIGARVRFTTAASPSPVTGSLFAVSSTQNLLAVNTAPPPPTPAASSPEQPADFHVIPLNSLTSFQVVSLASTVPSSFDEAAPQLHHVDLRAAKTRERAAIESEQRREAARGKDALGISIFDALSRTLPTRWHDESIIVLDAVMIAPPYTPSDCKAAPKDKTALNRVLKVLEMERKKFPEQKTSNSENGSSRRRSAVGNNMKTVSGTPTPTPPSTVPTGAARKGG
ncbi:MAG: hypothetical protein M1825_001690 [Sarcosagium campestre]|nr:MAG: hypothetical protein M1825_001690 [Sarcosagium campestre]